MAASATRNRKNEKKGSGGGTNKIVQFLHYYSWRSLNLKPKACRVNRKKIIVGIEIKMQIIPEQPEAKNRKANSKLANNLGPTSDFYSTRHMSTMIFGTIMELYDSLKKKIADKFIMDLMGFLFGSHMIFIWFFSFLKENYQSYIFS